MASLTSRLAGWAAGRLKGEKARKKTMEFVDETGVGKLLSLAGDAALLGGAGKLAGAAGRAVGAKLGIGGAGAAGAGTAAGGVAGPTYDVGAFRRPSTSLLGPTTSPAPFTPVSASQRIADMAKTMGTQPGGPGGAGSFLGRVGGAARAAGSYLAKKPEVAGMALSSLSQSRQAAANRELEREQMAQGQRQFEESLGLRKREEEREVERQRRIAEMLAPLFQRIAGGQG